MITGDETSVRAISVQSAPAAIGPYSQGVVAPPYVYVSGQLPIDPATGELDGSTAAVQAKRVLANLEAVLEAVGLTLADVVKTTVFLADLSDFAAVNEVYADRFVGSVLPARSTIEVAGLPRGAQVEIEAIAAIRAS
ncbi:Rid family detoxifying hydrolase [Agromyces badenianii]|uniref:Rid family detoxifying hydrolase n=1 Tax=Agromyces badenianii TaxID=2080742 RepID=UPI0030B823D0